MKDTEPYYSLSDIYLSDIHIISKNIDEIPLVNKSYKMHIKTLIEEINQSLEICYLKPNLTNDRHVLYINKIDLIFYIKPAYNVTEMAVTNHIYNACQIHNKMYLDFREETILSLLYKSHENLIDSMKAINETLQVIKDQQLIMCDIIDMKK